MEAIKNIKMVEAARNEAQKLIAEDPNLTAYPLLHARVDAERKDMHWE